MQILSFLYYAEEGGFDTLPVKTKVPKVPAINIDSEYAKHVSSTVSRTER